MEFLIILNLLGPPSEYESTISMIGGNTKARPVEQNAPIKLKSRFNLGTNPATAKVTRTIKVLNANSPING